MYRVQYYCPRSGNPNWQDLTEGWIWKTPQIFPNQGSAEQVCNGLLYQFHSARVIDPSGRVVYQI